MLIPFRIYYIGSTCQTGNSSVYQKGISVKIKSPEIKRSGLCNKLFERLFRWYVFQGFNKEYPEFFHRINIHLFIRRVRETDGGSK